MSDLKECEIINLITTSKKPGPIITTPCGKFWIGVDGYSIFKYNIINKHKVRVAGCATESGHKDGNRDESRFRVITGLALSKCCKILYIGCCDITCHNSCIRAICVETGDTTTIGNFFSYISNLKVSPDGNELVFVNYNNIAYLHIETDKIVKTKMDRVILDFEFSLDGQYIFICSMNNVSRLCIANGDILDDVVSFNGMFFCMTFSKDGQILFVCDLSTQCIYIVEVLTTEILHIIQNISTSYISLSHNGQEIYISQAKIQLIDISKYSIDMSNVKQFTQLQLFKHSFLPRQVINNL